MPAAKMTTSIGNDSGRTQLRNALTDFFHSHPPPSASGYPRWAAPLSSSSLPKRRQLHALPTIADPIALVVSRRIPRSSVFVSLPLVSAPLTSRPTRRAQESVKVLAQYGRLLSQACHSPETTRELASAPATYPLSLQWFERLAGPVQPLTPAASRRVDELLKIHGLCSTRACQRPEEAAFELAKTLPHFDRDLTAFYLRGKCAHEYELHVAHSQLRLSPDYRLTSLDDFARPWVSTWRNQGLVHVLALAAAHMPALTDWFPQPALAADVPHDEPPAESSAVAQGLVALLQDLPGARSEEETAGILKAFIESQRPHVATPTAQAIARTIDRLAVLMRVKSNARGEPGHDLDACLDAFPPLENLDVPDIWARIKPALEQAIPPSILALGDCHCKKKARVSNPPPSW